MYIPPPRYCSPCSRWGWKNNFGAPRGVRAWRWRWPPAPSCQRETRRGKGANFIPTAANRGVAFLFGHSPVSVPLDQFLLPHRHRRPLLLSPSPFSLSAAAAPAPLAPVSPGPPRRWTEGEGSGGKPRGRKLGTERAGRKGKKLRAAGAGGGRELLVAACFVCRPRRRLAARVSFPFPWSGPRASGWRRPGERKGTAASAGEDQPHVWLTLSRPASPCAGDAKTHTPAAEGHFSNAGKTHSPAARMGGGREFNHHQLSNVHFVPKTSPRCADLS